MKRSEKKVISIFDGSEKTGYLKKCISTLLRLRTRSASKLLYLYSNGSFTSRNRLAQDSDAFQ